MALREPDEIVVPLSDTEILASSIGFPAGKRSKWGPLLAAPDQ